MGCAGSSPAESETGPSGAPSEGKRGSVSKQGRASTAGKKGNKIVEDLFRATGEEKEFKHDEILIEQDSVKDSAYYIRSGKVKLLLRGENGQQQLLATRGAGEMLGELSLLLGNQATVTAMADGPVSAIEVAQSALMEQLRSEPANSGRLFKAMAVALAERISELSSKLRSNVTTAAAAPQQKSGQLPAADIAKARGMFGLPADEKLVGFYQCSVRAACATR